VGPAQHPPCICYIYTPPARPPHRKATQPRPRPHRLLRPASCTRRFVELAPPRPAPPRLARGSPTSFLLSLLVPCLRPAAAYPLHASAPPPAAGARDGIMDKYEPVRDIGSGNFGVARLMRNRETRGLVAVKLIERGHRVWSWLLCSSRLKGLDLGLVPRGCGGIRWSWFLLCVDQVDRALFLCRSTRMCTARSSTTARCGTRTSSSS
jgi:hypothetical protein